MSHPSSSQEPQRGGGWIRKFANAFRGVWLGVRGQSSFVVHVAATIFVIAAGILLRVSIVEWSVLLLCVALVTTAELFNSALERLALAITKEHDDHVGAALDIASGAVLAASIVSVVIGLLVLGPKLYALIFA